MQANARDEFIIGLAVQRRSPALEWYNKHLSATRVVTSLLVVTILWEFVGQVILTSPYLFSPLTGIAAASYRMLLTGVLQAHIATSLLEFIIGFAIAGAVGVALGLLIATSDKVRDYVDPLVMALYSTPLVALAPLFVIAFGIGLLSKVIVIFLVAFFPIVMNTVSGIRSTDQELIEAARSLGARRWQVFVKVLLPYAVPYILTGMRIGVGRGLVGIVVAEWYGARGGLGFLIWQSSQQLHTSELFSAVFVLMFAGIVSMVVLQRLERRLAPWREFKV